MNETEREHIEANARKVRCNMAAVTETRVSVSRVDDYIKEHPEKEWVGSDSQRLRPEAIKSNREKAVKQIVMSQFPGAWKDSHDIRCDFRGMDQEYHVVNQTLRDRALADAGIPVPMAPDESRAVKAEIGPPTCGGDMSKPELDDQERPKLDRRGDPRPVLDPLKQLDDPMLREQCRILENISGMAMNAMPSVRLTAAEFVTIIMEIKRYAEQAIQPSMPID